MLSFIILIVAVLVFILCLDALSGRAVVTGLLLRSVLLAFKVRAPGAARRLGIGDEVVEDVKAPIGANSLIGRVCKVEIAIAKGQGRISIDGVSWSALGPDTPVGLPVRIVNIDGNQLTVERYVPVS